MIKQNKVLLFFIASTTPTAPELKAAEGLNGYSVRFRNASLVAKDDKPEKCHAVAGAVPSQYLQLEDVKVFDTNTEIEDEEASEKPLARRTKAELIELLTDNSVEVPAGLSKEELIQLAKDNNLGS